MQLTLRKSLEKHNPELVKYLEQLEDTLDIISQELSIQDECLDDTMNEIHKIKRELYGSQKTVKKNS